METLPRRCRRVLQMGIIKQRGVDASHGVARVEIRI